MAAEAEAVERSAFELSSNRIDKAREKLEQAFGRLEHVVQSVAQQRAQPVEKGEDTGVAVEDYQILKDEVARLRSENGTLEELLEESEDNNAKLRQVTETVSTRLNAAITKLQNILGKQLEAEEA